VSFSPLLDLSYELSELSNRDAYLHAAGASLSRLLPGDDTFWLETDFAGGSASAWHGASGSLDPALGGLLSSAYDHPAIRSYLHDPGDLSPRRLSDVSATSTWRSSRAYELLSAPMGRHQLSLIVRLRPPGQGNGWTIGRAGQDFSDAEVVLAGSLLPLLTALDRLYERLSPDPGFAVHESRERAGLTPREGEMLVLLAEGFTAEAIGHLRRISSGTVRKHLEHVYFKLGCHDRLMAVQEARRLGILPSADQQRRHE
jgi:DNA-binding CsgD family transcriptional regulator